MSAQTPNPRTENLIGRTFGRLTVIAFHCGRPPRWLCSCLCGGTTVAFASALKVGRHKSCGCNKHPKKAVTHGHARKQPSLEYKTWCGIKRRCLNPNDVGYERYSKVGICERWAGSFEAFFADMGNRPSSKHTIDRIDNSRGYEPGNCRWATVEEQNQNKTTNILTPSDVLRIRRMAADGLSINYIAKRTGLTWRHAQLVVRGDLWGNVK